MIRIYVRKQNEESGHVFKSHFSVIDDKLSLFPFSFVLRGLISEDEYLQNNTTIAKRFGLYIKETKLDGRNKLARNLKYFTWERVLEPSISRRAYI